MKLANMKMITIIMDNSLIAGRFRLGPRISEGSFGTVLAGKDEQTGNPVAIKRLYLGKNIDKVLREI